MLGNYEFTFLLSNGKRAFVPSPGGRMRGEQIAKWVAKRWRSPPRNFFHLRRGGHVAAVKLHLADHAFGRVDLTSFFDSVTRGKVVRALQRIGWKHSEAWDDARESTVEKTPGKRDFSIPYGFVQSPILASLALHYSALGSVLAELKSRDVRASVYVDDIIISSSKPELIDVALRDVERAADASNFRINRAKTIGPLPEIEVFNVKLSHGLATVTKARMEKFEEGLPTATPASVAGTIGYVASINADQAALLQAISTGAHCA